MTLDDDLTSKQDAVAGVASAEFLARAPSGSGIVHRRIHQPATITISMAIPFP
jgi:hypothetical protein